MIVNLLTEQHLEFLSSKGDCTGWSESTLVTWLEIACRGSNIKGSWTVLMKDCPLKWPEKCFKENDSFPSKDGRFNYRIIRKNVSHWASTY